MKLQAPTKQATAPTPIPCRGMSHPSGGPTLSEQLRQLIRSALANGTPIERFAYLAYRSKCQHTYVERFLGGEGMRLRTVDRLLAGLGLAVVLSPTGRGAVEFSTPKDVPASGLEETLRRLFLKMVEDGRPLSDVALVMYDAIGQREMAKRFLYRGGGIDLYTADRTIAGLGLRATLVAHEQDAPEQLPAVLWREDGSGIPPYNVTLSDSTSTTPDTQQQ